MTLLPPVTRRFLLFLGLCVVIPATAEDLASRVEAAWKSSGAPAVAAAEFDAGRILDRVEVGVRRADEAAAVGAEDLWHIGSDGKAMTATLIARLVERKQLTWDTTVAEVFGARGKHFHPKAARITVRQLLNHTAGLPRNPSGELTTQAREDGDRQIRKQRLRVVDEALAGEPRTPPGTHYAYSNTGYIIAGAVVEQTLGETWEKAIEDEVFAPLGITSAGSGGPVGKSQPRGHRVSADGTRRPVGESFDGDNPAIYGPAGGIHLSLGDWVKFLQEHLLGHQGKGKLLSKDTYRELHRPALDHYAMGWVVTDDGEVIQHDGSNTFWFASAWLDLKKGRGVAIIANDAATETGPALHEAATSLLKR